MGHGLFRHARALVLAVGLALAATPAPVAAQDGAAQPVAVQQRPGDLNGPYAPPADPNAAYVPPADPNAAYVPPAQTAPAPAANEPTPLSPPEGEPSAASSAAFPGWQTVTPPAPPQQATTVQGALQPGDYVLGVGDRLRVIVFGEEALSGEFVVDSTGRVALPLIGEVYAAGASVRQFESNVAEALRQGYLNDPRVSAEVLNFRPFYILGEVARPGEYPYASNLTVFNAVATAGGFTPLANQSRVYVKRAGEETETEISLTGGTLVQPGDTIRIAKGAFYILGEVARPGEYPYTEGMTAVNAVATAGGFTYRANRGRIFIQRQGEPEERSYRLRPNLRLEPGDTIRVGERFF